MPGIARVIIRHACSGGDLADYFKEAIDRFKRAYLALNLTVTPKIHVIFDHITQFCEEKKSGLGKFSEQASESVHSDFKKT